MGTTQIPKIQERPEQDAPVAEEGRSQQFWLFPHWAVEARLNTGSRMIGDIHVRI